MTLTPNPSPQGRGAGPLTPNPSPPRGEGRKGPLTPDPSPPRGEGRKGPLTPDPSPPRERGKAPHPTALPQGERGEKASGVALAAAFQAARHSPRVVVLTAPGYFLADQQIDPRERVRLAGMEQPRQVLNLENPLLRFGLILARATPSQPAMARTPGC